MKIVGIGLNKTGTKTLGACLRYWELKHQSFSEEAFELWQRNDLEQLMKWVGEFDSFEDWPWPLFYKEIDQNYQKVKFILTKRRNAEVWFQSLRKHAERTGPTIFRKYVYGYEMPHDHKTDHIRFYEQHSESAREYFQSRPDDFLEVCWEDGDGWKELADFLRYKEPSIPFPHENKAPNE